MASRVVQEINVKFTTLAAFASIFQTKYVPGSSFCRFHSKFSVVSRKLFQVKKRLKHGSLI
jgi:hypothetical protein